MSKAESVTGTIVLNAIPEGDDAQKVIHYLAGVFKNASVETIIDLVQITPRTLKKDVPEKTGRTIVEELIRLGASAQFVIPEPSPPPETTAPPEADADPEKIRNLILSAFKQPLPQIPVSFTYKLGLFITALGMLALPLIYIALVGGAAYLLIWHMVDNTHLITESANAGLGLILYGAPSVIGVVLILFMIKPFFAKKAYDFMPRPLDRRDEPLLFAFAEQIAELVGAPAPTLICVDTRVNTSAALRRGWASLGSNDLSLTIGLPLVEGLSVNQLAGVIAHEFGHFAQSTGMRLSYIIRAINTWFARVVYERDEWDERLARLSQSGGLRFAAVFLTARGCIWLTRRLLRLFMMLGNLISAYMSRQMEYDADKYETLLVGSDVFRTTVERLAILDQAYRLAMRELSRVWQDGRLVDNFPALVTANKNLIPDADIEKLIQMAIDDAPVSRLDTHPADRERIAQAWEYNARPLFEVQSREPALTAYIRQSRYAGADFADSPPAAVLFTDFDCLAREVSKAFYEFQIDEPITEDKLVGVDTVVETHDAEHAAQQALNRLFQGGFCVYRPLGLGSAGSGKHLSPQRAAQVMADLREAASRLGNEYKDAVKLFYKLLERMVIISRFRALSAAGFQLDPADFKLGSDDPAAVDETEKRTRAELLNVTERMTAFEQAVGGRMTAAFDLVRTMDAGTKDKEAYVQIIDTLLPAARLLEAYLEDLIALGTLRDQLVMLARQLETNLDNIRFMNHFKEKTAAVRRHLHTLGKHLDAQTYPFDHVEANLTLAEYVIGQIPETDDAQRLIEVIDDTQERFTLVYSRIAARLAQTAEEIEAAFASP